MNSSYHFSSLHNIELKSKLISGYWIMWSFRCMNDNIAAYRCTEEVTRNSMQKSSATRWKRSKERSKNQNHNWASRCLWDRQFAHVLSGAIPLKNRENLRGLWLSMCWWAACGFMSLCDRCDAAMLQRAPRAWIGSHFLFTTYHRTCWYSLPHVRRT